MPLWRGFWERDSESWTAPTRPAPGSRTPAAGLEILILGWGAFPCAHSGSGAPSPFGRAPGCRSALLPRAASPSVKEENPTANAGLHGVCRSALSPC